MTFLTPSTTWRIHEGTESALLIDGRDYYRAFYAAALQATRSILLLGWQFDSDVQLVRGEDLPLGVAPENVQLLSLLDRCCRERAELEARVLAWDHSVFFALERQLLQKLYFDATGSERFIFRWDSTVPLGGSHHQKVAIIDGRIAFFGSQDICQSRWDDSSHRPKNKLRTSRNATYPPYHEVQMVVTGEAARSMLELFTWRWYGATGEQLDPDSLVAEPRTAARCAVPAAFAALASDVEGLVEGSRNRSPLRSLAPLGSAVTLPMPPAPVGLARTIPGIPGRGHIGEVTELYVRAIERAERLIYVESQYVTSRAVRDALVARMSSSSRPKLDIVMILPRKPENFKEEVTVGVPQAQVLQTLSDSAKSHGHSLGIFNVLAGHRADGVPLYVYIHAKLMIVDDRLLVVGSANLTNRSMTIDSEIVAAYEATSGDVGIRNAIRLARVRLLLEHVGGDASVRALVRPEGLAARLHALADSGRSRLRRHELRRDEPSAVARAVHELTLEFLDPWDEGERCPPAA